MNRRKIQISEAIGQLLVKQSAHELKNYNLYNSFANYFSLEGLVSLEEYYKKRALEEKNHHDWILTFLSDCDYRLEYPIIEQNTEQSVKNLIDPFYATVEREIQTTEMIYHIYDQAISEKDYMTCSWLLELLIKEQVEEESLSRMALTIMEKNGDIFVKAEEVLNLLEN